MVSLWFGEGVVDRSSAVVEDGEVVLLVAVEVEGEVLELWLLLEDELERVACACRPMAATKNRRELLTTLRGVFME